MTAKHDPWAKVPRSLIERACRVCPWGFAVVVALLSYDGDGRGAWPSLRTLAGIVGRSRDAVRVVLNAYVKGGILTAERRNRKPTVYRLASGVDATSVDATSVDARGASGVDATHLVVCTPPDQTLQTQNDQTHSRAAGASPSRLGPVDEVFGYWQQATGRPKAQLLGARRRKIEKALRSYSVEDLKAAILGCTLTPWNAGQNPNGRKYTDLHLILRDESKIEAFMEAARNPPKPVTPKKAAEAYSDDPWKGRPGGVVLQ